MAQTEIFDAAVNVVVQFLAPERQEVFMNKKRKRRCGYVGGQQQGINLWLPKRYEGCSQVKKNRSF
jgi:hypothetical protein